MRAFAIAAALAILGSGCANDPSHQLAKRLRETTLIAEDITNTPPSQEALIAAAKYAELAEQATPSIWTPGTNWRFEVDPLDGHSPDVAIFRITDRPATGTCIGGDWRELEVVHAEGLDPKKPAYLVTGRNLVVLVSTGLCDAYDEIKGELSETGFRGWRSSSGMFGSNRTGRAIGRPVSRRQGVRNGV